MKNSNTDKFIGQKYGRLEVLAKSEKRTKQGNWYYLVRCDCESRTEKLVLMCSLVSGSTKSCGCYGIEQNLIRLLGKTGPQANQFKHGMSKTPIYSQWCKMKRRCRNPNDPDYPTYGGAGIKVDPEWHNFENFYRDMGDRPFKNASLDRIDTTKGYYPGNVRWATPTQQVRNRKISVSVTYRGETKLLIEFCEALNLDYETMRHRINGKGWTAERAFSTPIGAKGSNGTKTILRTS